MEWLAVSVGIGLIVSLLFTEAFGLSVGGMIVPGYLALYLDQPLTIVMTIAAALITWGCVRTLNRQAILFGRRRVVVTMVVGFAVAGIMRSAMDWSALSISDLAVSDLVWSAADSPESDAVSTEGILVGMTVVGFVIPGLIALWIDRSGVVQTLSPMLIASCLVRLVLVLFEVPGVI